MELECDSKIEYLPSICEALDSILIFSKGITTENRAGGLFVSWIEATKADIFALCSVSKEETFSPL